MARIQRKLRVRRVDSYAAAKRRDELIASLALRGLTLERMKQLAVEMHYSQSMFVDIVQRDHDDLLIASGMSRKALRNLLVKLGVKHDNAAYLKLPQEVRLSISLTKVR
jgi:hypothetical protein